MVLSKCRVGMIFSLIQVVFEENSVKYQIEDSNSLYIRDYNYECLKDSNVQSVSYYGFKRY